MPWYSMQYGGSFESGNSARIIYMCRLTAYILPPPHFYGDMWGELYILSPEKEFLSTLCCCCTVLRRIGFHLIIIIIISNDDDISSFFLIL